MPGDPGPADTQRMKRDGPQSSTSPSGAEVAVVIDHPALRELVVTLLERSDPSWKVTATADSRPLAGRLSNDAPDVVVVDAGDVQRCCRATFAAFPRQRLIVIGPQPGADYERVARRSGVGGWLPRERVADDLPGLVRAAAAERFTHRHQGGRP